MHDHIMTQELYDKLKKIKLIAFDFDGIFTDGFVYFAEDGKETVRCSRKDSLGINMLKKAGIGVYVVSKETNAVVSERCKKMGIPCVHKVENSEGKREIIERICEEQNISPEGMAFMGDDINDIAAMQYAGVAITVGDAHEETIRIADYVTTRRGGDHAVREVCELILQAKNVPIEY